MTSPWLKKFFFKLTAQKYPQTEGVSKTRVKDFAMAEENFDIISSKMPPDGRISKIRVNDFTTVEENSQFLRNNPDRRYFKDKREAYTMIEEIF